MYVFMELNFVHGKEKFLVVNATNNAILFSYMNTIRNVCIVKCYFRCILKFNSIIVTFQLLKLTK